MALEIDELNHFKDNETKTNKTIYILCGICHDYVVHAIYFDTAALFFVCRSALLCFKVKAWINSYLKLKTIRYIRLFIPEYKICSIHPSVAGSCCWVCGRRLSWSLPNHRTCAADYLPSNNYANQCCRGADISTHLRIYHNTEINARHIFHRVGPNWIQLSYDTSMQPLSWTFCISYLNRYPFMLPSTSCWACPGYIMSNMSLKS